MTKRTMKIMMKMDNPKMPRSELITSNAICVDSLTLKQFPVLMLLPEVGLLSALLLLTTSTMSAVALDISGCSSSSSNSIYPVRMESDVSRIEPLTSKFSRSSVDQAVSEHYLSKNAITICNFCTSHKYLKLLLFIASFDGSIATALSYYGMPSKKIDADCNNL